MKALVFAALLFYDLCLWRHSSAESVAAQLVTPFPSVIRDSSAQRAGRANTTGSLLVVSDQHSYFSFSVSNDGESFHKEKTAFR